jgi:hypothetical protein
MMLSTRIHIILIVMICLSLVSNVWGDIEMSTPSGQVILEVSGNIKQTNSFKEAHFDIEMLDSLPQHTIRTSTLWTDGVKEFSGPKFLDLLNFIGAREGTLTLIALNDYRIIIPRSDLKNYPVILATRQDGNLLRVRNKGPIWVVYPWDDFPELSSEVFVARSIWQLRRVIIE